MIVYSHEITDKLTHNVPNQYVKRVLNGNFKPFIKAGRPRGIWISINNGWENFCADGNFNKGCETTQFDVKLLPKLKILMIDELHHIESYWKKFTDYEMPTYKFTMDDSIVMVNFWKWLRNQGFDGVAMTNNGINETKMTFLNGWDCESLVLYNPKDLILKKVN